MGLRPRHHHTSCWKERAALLLPPTAGTNTLLLHRASRSGQSTFSEGVKRRDQNMCVFCDATDNVTAAHLVAFKEFNSPEASLVPVFAKCRISSIQASENGIALCQNYHDQFDHHFVGVNPDTSIWGVAGVEKSCCQREVE
jgi:hypothetical protein